MFVRVCVCVCARTQSSPFDLSLSGILLLISKVLFMCEWRSSKGVRVLTVFLNSALLIIWKNRSRYSFTHLSVSRPYCQGTVAKPKGVAMETLLFTACAQVKC